MLLLILRLLLSVGLVRVEVGLSPVVIVETVLRIKLCANPFPGVPAAGGGGYYFVLLTNHGRRYLLTLSALGGVVVCRCGLIVLGDINFR